MGEAKQRSRSKAQVLRDNPRCIYCLSPAKTVEHMPPRTMFKDRHRLSGMEFGCCEACNNGTKAADAIASFLAHSSPTAGLHTEWQTPVMRKLMDTAEQLEPGFHNEFFNKEKSQKTYLKTESSILMPVVMINADGPIVKRSMTKFSAKLAMALFREHVGKPLSEGSGVFVKWFLNAGLSEDQAHGYLSILPLHGEMRQGAQRSIEQFGYRYNCDGRSLIAAMIGFHSNLHIFVIATSDLCTFGAPLSKHKSLTLVKFGELLKPVSTKL
jgi:hypothetical protein